MYFLDGLLEVFYAANNCLRKMRSDLYGLFKTFSGANEGMHS